MNVREMIEEIPKQFPLADILEPRLNDRSPDWNWFRVKLPNGWLISCGYGRAHRSSNRTERLADPKDSETVEIAIFDSDGEWYLAEGMDIASEGTTGVLGWRTSDEVFQIVEYISMKEVRL